MKSPRADHEIPIRSPRYDAPHGGKILTDRIILRYLLAGHYGEAARVRALANLPPKRKPKADKITLGDVLKLLKSKP